MEEFNKGGTEHTAGKRARKSVKENREVGQHKCKRMEIKHDNTRIKSRRI